MARREKAYSLSSLIYHLLKDGDSHSLREIAQFIQQYMYKNTPVEEAEKILKLMLEKDSKIEKTEKGFKLRIDASLNDIVAELLMDANAPLSAKDICKKVAKKENVPIDAVRLDLDNDERFTKVVYKSKNYYYLARRRVVNDKVYEILKKKNRPLSFQEIYRNLESEYELKKEDVIFLPREDKNIKHHPGLKYTLKSKTIKKKAAKPIHYITRSELERVVAYLKKTGERLSPAELSKAVLKYPVEQTNLRLKLARDPRLKRDDGTFYFEEEKKKLEIPPKIRERVASLYFKVKARMVGKSELHTIESLLEIYKVNITHDDFDIYKKLLEDHLLRDEGIARVVGGWIRAENHEKINIPLPKSFESVKLPDPEPPLQEEQLSEEEHQFLKKAHAEIDDGGDKLVFHITPPQKKHGIIPISAFQKTLLPGLPGFYEITIRIESVPYIVFVDRSKSLMINMAPSFMELLPDSGGVLELKPSEESPYHFTGIINQPPPELCIDSDIIRKLDALSEEDDIPLHEILFTCFTLCEGKPMHLEQIWTAVNTVRSVQRSDILAVLLDYACFEKDPEKPGYYRFDAKRKHERKSIVELPVQVKADVTQPAAAAPVAVKEKVLFKKAEEKVAGISGKKKEKAKAKKAASLKSESKRQRKIKSADALPEHLRRLKHFERRLPRLQNTRSLVVKPSGKESSRIGAVSAGKIERPVRKERIKRRKPDVPVLLKPKPLPAQKDTWNASTYVNPDKGSGYSELHMTLEVLKAFISRAPQTRKTDGAVVIFLDKNDIAVYFRIPPENPACWIAWIPKQDIEQVEGAEAFLTEGNKRAKFSEEGYWWATQKFKGPRGNWRDNNVLEGVEIVGKIIALMEGQRKTRA